MIYICSVPFKLIGAIGTSSMKLYINHSMSFSYIYISSVFLVLLLMPLGLSPNWSTLELLMRF
jgi:hypothetical protein